VRDLSASNKQVYLELEVHRLYCLRCQKVRQETLKFPAENPFYTRRFGSYTGTHCRGSSISEVAKEFHLDWRTV
jgi:transposase